MWLACGAALGGAWLIMPAAAQPVAPPAHIPPHSAPAQQARLGAFAALPHWPGYWVAQGQEGTTIGGIAPAVLAARETGAPLTNFMTLRASGAAWNAEGRRRLAAAQARVAGRKAVGWGFPMMMNAATPIEFIITPEKVLIINAYNEARHIYMRETMFDEDDLWPSVLGTSVGRWEGETLVIETVMVKTPNDYFHGAPVFSQEAHYIERIHMAGDRLVSEVVVTDPVTLDAPFHATVAWVRDAGFDRMIQIDWDNDRTGVDEQGINTIEEEIVP